MDRKLSNERYEQELTEIHEGLCSLLSRTSRCLVATLSGEAINAR